MKFVCECKKQVLTMKPGWGTSTRCKTCGSKYEEVYPNMHGANRRMVRKIERISK